MKPTRKQLVEFARRKKTQVLALRRKLNWQEDVAANRAKEIDRLENQITSMKRRRLWLLVGMGVLTFVGIMLLLRPAQVRLFFSGSVQAKTPARSVGGARERVGSRSVVVGNDNRLTPFPAIVGTTVDERLVAYFKIGNPPSNAVSHRLGERVVPRSVTQKTKGRIIERDYARCVVCGKTDQIEVDHVRALMNGGNNAVDNLATLCRDCHVKKSRMDRSLHRQREKRLKSQ